MTDFLEGSSGLQSGMYLETYELAGKQNGFLSLERTIAHDLEALEESVVPLTVLLEK